ncbi:Long-chain-fatty-acid--CoA ligase FadD15 [Delftia tsuruhatensis]|uniref:AMP-dependent synthetase/ligase n=1 Tax=Delftia tsuruhatensis TaxID=180282 RepID=UPI001F1B52CD|nr:long-chain fatty acid--CoA ligase [Delftia tsuruhatensis]CAB5703338.1 Long-chain-fatty-acid--CoA ligase FadD15 [Delftia tsuruhatensis]
MSIQDPARTPSLALSLPADAGMATATTLVEMLALRVRQTPDGEAYRAYDEEARSWKSLNWSQTGERVARWARALAAQELAPGSRIAILLPNGLDAMSIDLATLRCGHVPVPLHAIDNAGSIAYILANAQVSLLFVAQASTWDRICATGQELPQLRKVVVASPTAAPKTALDGQQVADAAIEALRRIPVQPLQQWLDEGDAAARTLPSPPTAEDLAAVVYTSGTTGKPKGVMLTHRNVVSNVQAVMQRLQPRSDDVFLSFLPLSHTFERTAGYYLALAVGACVAYARSVAQLSEDLKTQRPTVLVSVPRIYERVHAKVMEALARSPLKARLFETAQAKGWQRFRASQGIAADAQPPQPELPGWMQWLPWSVLDHLVARPLLAQFGGRVRVAVSGGAPLSPTIARCFLGMGLPLIQGYGMTETSPVVCANTLEDNHPATVGRALPGVEVRIGENKELQVRGPCVMRGYWERPEDTAKTFTEDGWLRTGDQAAIEDGRVRIQGRIKEIIVTSTGEKIPPADLELAITGDPFFTQAFVVGEDRPFIAAVAVVERGEWQAMAQRLGLDPQDPQSLNHPAAEREALARIEKQVASFARYAVPRALHLELEPWTIENGLMTPTLKLKRNNLMARFDAQIAAMYTKPSDRWQGRNGAG